MRLIVSLFVAAAAIASANAAEFTLAAGAGFRRPLAELAGAVRLPIGT